MYVKKLFFNSFVALAATIAALSSLAAQNLAAEVKPAAADPGFQDKIEKYLQSERGRDQVGMAIEKYMQEKQKNMAKRQEEEESAQLEDQFKNPVKIDVSKAPVKGPASAKITIVEFSDFQCPYCSRGKDTMEQVLKAYPNDVKVAFMNLPLPFHKQAMPAAKAALAAHKQGKFWEMHDELFANQGALSDAFYEEAAKKIGLNVDKFKTDLNDPTIEAQIKSDAAVAEKNGIQGTPGFFVNGVAVKGAYPFDHFKKLIDRWLAKK